MVISVTGGKGGTGKSTISVNLAVLLKFTLVDLDVETPNAHILLRENLRNREEVYSFYPVFCWESCLKCGACANACNDNAILMNAEGYPFLIESLCSGCTACKLACPEKGAIKEGARVIGFTYSFETNYGFRLITGELLEGEEKTFKVLLQAKKRALKEGGENLIIDTAAGSGNSVFKALEGSDLVIAVTEPTPFGASDLERILRIADHLSIKTWIVINRSSTGDEREIEKLADMFNAKVIERIPYSTQIVESYFSGVPISLSDSPDALPFKRLCKRILEEMNADNNSKR